MGALPKPKGPFVLYSTVVSCLSLLAAGREEGCTRGRGVHRLAAGPRECNVDACLVCPRLDSAAAAAFRFEGFCARSGRSSACT